MAQRLHEVSMRLLRPALFVVLSVTLGACSTVQKAAADLLISDEQEEQLGAQVKTELETKEGLKYFNDPVVEQYVKDLFAKVSVKADADREGVTWKVYVVDDANTVNAFATPGGYIYFITGLLLTADNEAEILGVAAHEAGHVVGRHSARQMINQYGLQTIISVALGDDASTLEQIASAIAANGALLAYSRSNETESDEYAAKYTSEAGYDPHGIATFFEKLKANEGSTPQVFKWLSTHPDTGDRITHINEYITQNNLGGPTSTGDAASLAEIKQRIQSRAGLVQGDAGTP